MERFEQVALIALLQSRPGRSRLVGHHGRSHRQRQRDGDLAEVFAGHAVRRAWHREPTDNRE